MFCSNFIVFGQDGPPCGTQSMTDQEYIYLAQQIQNGLQSTSTPDNMPIHITIIDNDGQTDWLPSPDFNAVEDELNSFFDNGMSFYFCDVTIVGSSTLIDFQNSEWQALMNLHFVTDAINLYCVNSIFDNAAIGGVANFPDSPFNNMIVVRDHSGEGPLAHAIAHELGHYFGLQHTFLGTGYVQDEICLSITPPALQLNCDINTVALELCPLNCGLDETCIPHGDGFCDTPADPGNLYTNPQEGCYTTSGCADVICLEPNDPLGDFYTPDPTLIMSYYGYFCTPQHFSNDQNQFMLDVLNNHPNKAFLWNANPDCSSFYSSYGFIGAVIESSPNGEELFSLVPVDLTDVANNDACWNPTSIVSSIKGKYRLFNCFFFPGEDLNITAKPRNDYSGNEDMAPNFEVYDLDAAIVGAYAAGLPYYEDPNNPGQTYTLDTPYKLIAADVNFDGQITTHNAALIQQVVNGRGTVNFEYGSWRYVPSYYLENPSFSSVFEVSPFDAIWTPSGVGVPRPYMPDPGAGIKSYMDEIEINLLSDEAMEEITWSFVAVKMGDVDNSIQMLSNAPLGGGTTSFVDNSVDNNKKIKNLQEGSLGNDTHLLSSIYPNPFTNEISIEIELNQPEEVSLQIVDALGVSIGKLYALPKGKQTFQVSDVSQLANGVLHYRLELGDNVFTGTILKTD